MARLWLPIQIHVKPNWLWSSQTIPRRAATEKSQLVWEKLVTCWGDDESRAEEDDGSGSGHGETHFRVFWEGDGQEKCPGVYSQDGRTRTTVGGSCIGSLRPPGPPTAQTIVAPTLPFRLAPLREATVSLAITKRLHTYTVRSLAENDVLFFVQPISARYTASMADCVSLRSYWISFLVSH